MMEICAFLYCDHIVPIGLGNPFGKFRWDNVYVMRVIYLYTVYSVHVHISAHSFKHPCAKNNVSLKQDGH